MKVLKTSWGILVVAPGMSVSIGSPLAEGDKHTVVAFIDGKPTALAEVPSRKVAEGLVHNIGAYIASNSLIPLDLQHWIDRMIQSQK